MKKRINLKSLMLILSALRCACSSNNTVYYVLPDVDCPRDIIMCHNLNYYGTAQLKLPENNTVTVILLEGYHTVHYSVYNFGSPDNSHTLYVRGDSQSSNAVKVDGVQGAITVNNMILERFTASNIHMYIDESVVNSQITHILIINCTFIELLLLAMAI